MQTSLALEARFRKVKFMCFDGKVEASSAAEESINGRRTTSGWNCIQICSRHIVCKLWIGAVHIERNMGLGIGVGWLVVGLRGGLPVFNQLLAWQGLGPKGCS